VRYLHSLQIFDSLRLVQFSIHNFNTIIRSSAQQIVVNMHTSILAISTLLTLSTAFPQRNRNGATSNGGGRQQQATAQQKAAQVPQGLSQATDGSMIMDDTVMVKYALPLPHPHSPSRYTY
jgi:hypothetical protein